MTAKEAETSKHIAKFFRVVGKYRSQKYAWTSALLKGGIIAEWFKLCKT